MKHLASAAVITVLWLRAVFVFSLPPDRMGDLAVYPGAREVRCVTEGSSTDAMYESPDRASAVVAHYVQTLGFRPEAGETEYVPMVFWAAPGAQCMVFFDEARTSTFAWARGAASGGLFQWEGREIDGVRSVFVLKIGAADDGRAVTQISLTVSSIDVGKIQAQTLAFAVEAERAADAMTAALDAVNPAQQELVERLRAEPPTQKELQELVRGEYGVPLYPGATLQLRAMEIYAMELWGGIEGYWFLARAMPDKVVAYYERVTGNGAYQSGLDMARHIDITDTEGSVVGHIAVYQGTTALYLSQEPGDADPDDVLNVSTIGFYRAGEPIGPEGGGDAGGR